MVSLISLTIAAHSSAREAIAGLFEREHTGIAIRYKTPTGKEPVPAPCVIACELDSTDGGAEITKEFAEWVFRLDYEMHCVAKPPANG